MGRVTGLVKEPNLILALIGAGITLAVSFGWDPTDDQVAAITGFLSLLLVAVRFLVTWKPDVAARVNSKGIVVAGPAAVNTTGTELPYDGHVHADDGYVSASLVVREPPGEHRRFT